MIGPTGLWTISCQSSVEFLQVGNTHPATEHRVDSVLRSPLSTSPPKEEWPTILNKKRPEGSCFKGHEIMECLAWQMPMLFHQLITVSPFSTHSSYSLDPRND